MLAFLTNELRTDLVLMKTPRMITLTLSSFERNVRFVNKSAHTKKGLPTNHVALAVGVSAEEEVVVGRLGVDGRQLELLIREHRIDSVTCLETEIVVRRDSLNWLVSL